MQRSTAAALVPLLCTVFLLAPGTVAGDGATAARGSHSPFDPRGKLHIPIGLPNTLDTLKTFVEPEGDFSPGVGSYGVYFWVYDPAGRKLTAPTQPGVPVEHGLAPGGLLIPWSRWDAGGVSVRTEVCETRCASPAGDVFVDAARATLSNEGGAERKVSLIVAVRAIGPAGWPVHRVTAEAEERALLVEWQPAVVADRKPDAAGARDDGDIGEAIEKEGGALPAANNERSDGGDCSGALRFDLTLAPHQGRTLGFVCPVLPGRRAVGHKWDNKSPWAQLDENSPNPPEGTPGAVLQPSPGLEFYRGLKVDDLFARAEAYWKGLVGKATIHAPDPRWGECFAAVTGHVAMAMNENAPDVAVVNYNVFNRDGVYVTNILQKSGNFDLAADAIDYFLQHPFNGRVKPEADNPGQVLWVLGQHWQFAHDKAWLAKVYPSVRKLAAMVEYYRTTPGPHWVSATSLDFGDALPADRRQRLVPGACDGSHPEYTEAFDVAGLRAAAGLAEAAGDAARREAWQKLADDLFRQYDRRFSADLGKGYGSYCVLWPCRLYPPDRGKAHDRFEKTGAQKPTSWRYFPLAAAHQGLLAGNRQAGCGTLEAHLSHEQMRGWYAFDEGGEGGKSGPGNWPKLRTTWGPDVAMPHGWAEAEVHLLLRDCLLFEDGDKLVLLAGVPEAWLTGDGSREPIEVTGLPTPFGPCSFRYVPEGGGGEGGTTLTLGAACDPPGGFVLRLPRGPRWSVSVEGRAVKVEGRGGNVDVALPRGARIVSLGIHSLSPVPRGEGRGEGQK